MISLSLKKWIESTYPKLYAKVDSVHQWETHISNVIKYSLQIAENIYKTRKQELNFDIVYTVAALHDIGLLIERKKHELYSKKHIEIKIKQKLLSWFTEDEITIIAEAVQDHRGSSEISPRTIYGEIVADADKIHTLDELLIRTWNYRINCFPYLNTVNKVIEDICIEMDKDYRYGHKSKIKMPESILINKPFQDEISKIAVDKNKLKHRILTLLNEGKIATTTLVAESALNYPCNEIKEPIYYKW